MARRTSAMTATDAILPMTDDYMQEIVRREKNHEFRRYRINASVRRIWFYLNAPRSSIVYVCEIDPARTRGKGHDPLPVDGEGNHEFNTYHKDWDGYDFAYRIRSVRKLIQPLTLADMKGKYGFKLAPRGLVYLQPQMAADVPWDEQELIWSLDVEQDGGNTPPEAIPSYPISKAGKRTREETVGNEVVRPPKLPKSVTHAISGLV